MTRYATGTVRLLAASARYRVCDMHCLMGPSDPANDNQYPAFRVVAVLAGTFAIRSSLGSGVPIAGSLLMGNAGDGYTCRHPLAGGDRCISFDFDGEFLEQVRSTIGCGGVGERFRRALLAPSWDSVAMSAVMEAVASGGDARALHEAAFEIAARALTATGARTNVGRRPSFRDESRAMRAARYIEARFDRPCTLDELATEVSMSAFHFLRVFRRVTGQTPHRTLLATRLRHAARRLRSTRDPIVVVAAAVGFEDLSNFNASFRRAFGVTPHSWRSSRCPNGLRR